MSDFTAFADIFKSDHMGNDLLVGYTCKWCDHQNVIATDLDPDEHASALAEIYDEMLASCVDCIRESARKELHEAMDFIERAEALMEVYDSAGKAKYGL